MAIPFNVEDAENNEDEIVLQQLLSELCQTIQQFRIVQRGRGPPPLYPRPRAIWTLPAIQVSTNPRNLEHGVNVAFSLFPYVLQNDLSTPPSQNATTPGISGENNRAGHLRTELCYDETKQLKISVSVEVINRDWPKQEEVVQEANQNRSGPRGLLSKLVPVPFGGPIWTAVLCVVGWHLLRAR